MLLLALCLRLGLFGRYLWQGYYCRKLEHGHQIYALTSRWSRGEGPHIHYMFEGCCDAPHLAASDAPVPSKLHKRPWGYSLLLGSRRQHRTGVPAHAHVDNLIGKSLEVGDSSFPSFGMQAQFGTRSSTLFCNMVLSWCPDGLGPVQTSFAHPLWTHTRPPHCLRLVKSCLLRGLNPSRAE